MGEEGVEMGVGSHCVECGVWGLTPDSPHLPEPSHLFAVLPEMAWAFWTTVPSFLYLFPSRPHPR